METEQFDKNKKWFSDIIEDKRVLVFSKYAHSINLDSSQIKEFKDLDKTKNVLDLSSDAKKMIIYVNHSPYHLINDIVGDVCWFLNQSDNHQVILNLEFEDYQASAPAGKDSRKYVMDIVEMLKKEYKSRLLVYSLAKYDAVIVNNFYVNYAPISMANRTNSSYDFFKKAADLNSSVVPTKKVYLSRRYNTGQKFLAIHEGMPIEIDHDRIKNESLLEAFFSSRGFEIVRPEEFSSFKEQAQFFSEVSTLVSVTSSGLVNSLFMKPGQLVVELMTLLPLINGRMSLVDHNPPRFEVEEYILEAHHFYKTMAYIKEHTYVSISNLDKKSETIIKSIESNKVLSSIF